MKSEIYELQKSNVMSKKIITIWTALVMIASVLFPLHGNSQTAVVEVINPTTGDTWMDRNLGASQAATSSTDANSYGDLYQWGRTADGHENRASNITTTLSDSDNPGHGNFIRSGSSSPYDWRSPQNDNLWQGVSGINNPCPMGYRLPTEAEWEAERTSWNTNDATGAFASPLKLPVPGLRYYSNGNLAYVGGFGYYWSSTVDDTNSRTLELQSDNAFWVSYKRASGFSVRCLKQECDTPDTPTGEASQSFSPGAKLEDIVVSPSDVFWFATENDALAGANPLPLDTELGDGETYYAVNIVDTCLSEPFPVTVNIVLDLNEFGRFDFSYYPNPTTGIIYLQAEKQIERVEVYTIQGSKLPAHLSESGKTIDISNLSVGVYFVKVTVEGQSQTYRIIKE